MITYVTLEENMANTIRSSRKVDPNSGVSSVYYYLINNVLLFVSIFLRTNIIIIIIITMIIIVGIRYVIKENDRKNVCYRNIKLYNISTVFNWSERNIPSGIIYFTSILFAI